MSSPPGVEQLRRQIARRSLEYGCNFSPSEIVTTNGAMEALNLSLRAVARPGDVIALESPTYFGVLEAVQSLGMRAIEIPTHPSEGMSCEMLESAIRKHRIKACVIMANGHNPLGYVLSDDVKKRLVDLTSKYEVALIEDNIIRRSGVWRAATEAGKSIRSQGHSASLLVVFQSPGAWFSRGVGAAGPLSGGSGASQVHQHGRHAFPAPIGDRGISGIGGIRALPGTAAHGAGGKCSAGEPGRGEVFSRRDAHHTARCWIPALG